MTDSEMNKLEDDRKEVGPSDIDELDSDRKTIGTSKTSRGDDNQETSSIKGLDDDRKTIGTSEVSRPDNNQKSCRASHNISELDNHQKSIETSEVSGQDDNRTSVGTSSLGELDSNQKSIRFSDTKELEGADAGTPSHQDAVFLEFTEHVPEMEHKSKGSDSSEPYEKITNARRMVIELPYPGNSQKHQIPKIFVETPSETTDANFYLPTPKVSAFTEQSQSERRPQRPASSRASFPSESVSKNPQNPSPPESSVGTVPRPSQVRKRKKYLNKVRNVAVRKTILKITLGRQLAGQTKPALKLLATGEAVTFDLVTRA